jgi:hypothetical protein
MITRRLVAGAVPLFLSFFSTCAADTITIDGVTYENVVVDATSQLYYVRFPADGTVQSILKSEIADEDLVKLTDEAARQVLLEEWKRKHDENAKQKAYAQAQSEAKEAARLAALARERRGRLAEEERKAEAYRGRKRAEAESQRLAEEQRAREEAAEKEREEALATIRQLVHERPTIREVETDLPSFVGKMFVLEGALDVSSYYNWGYMDARESHYAFELSQGLFNTAHLYMPRNTEARGIRETLLESESPLYGFFLVTMDASRYDSGSWEVMARLVGVVPYEVTHLELD